MADLAERRFSRRIQPRMLDRACSFVSQKIGVEIVDIGMPACCATASARSNANGFAEDAPNAGARNGADIRDCVYQTLGQTFGSVSVDDRPSRVCEIEDIVTAGTHEERIYIQTVRRVADGSVVSSLVRFSIRNGHSFSN